MGREGTHLPLPPSPCMPITRWTLKGLFCQPRTSMLKDTFLFPCFRPSREPPPPWDSCGSA